MANHKEQTLDARPWGVHRLWFRNLIVAAILAVVWLVFDRVTKVFFEGAAVPGETIVADVGNLGLIRFDLIHNTGAAWGSFAGSVPVLIVVTAMVCLAIAAFAIYWAREASLFEMAALALLFAGGVGNLYDRITQGYVIDFITPLFIDFPTFNVADIGVTCGVIMLVLAWIVQAIQEHEKQTHEKQAHEKE